MICGGERAWVVVEQTHTPVKGTVTGSGLTSHGSRFTLTGRRDGTRLTFLQTIEGDTENDCEYNIIGETAEGSWIQKDSTPEGASLLTRFASSAPELSLRDVAPSPSNAFALWLAGHCAANADVAFSSHACRRLL